MFGRIIVGIGALTLLGSSPVASWAQDNQNEIRARELFDQGVAAAEAEEYAAAVEAFLESYDLVALSGTLLNAGLFQLRGGWRVDAHRTLTELLQLHGDEISDLARLEVTRHLNELEAALSFVDVETRPRGATILVDGEDHGQSPLSDQLLLEPGTYTFEARLDDHEPATETRELEAGENYVIELELLSEPAQLPVEPDESLVEPASPPEEERRSFWRGPWPWIIGAVVVGAAAVVLGVTLSEDEPQPDWTLRVQ